MRVSKRLFALVLCFLVFISIPTISAFAWGGAGAEASPGNDNGHKGDFPLTNGYGFRVYLYDFDKYGEFWEGDNPYVLLPSNNFGSFADIFDRCASESAFYLGVPSNYKAYDAQYGSTPWVGINTMSASEFNTMPGMSGYTNPSGNYARIDFTKYIDVFNKISEQVESIDGMQEVLDWFSAHGVDTSGYNPEATLVVVEPVVKWYYGNMKWVTTYQNARKFDGTRSGVHEYFNFNWSMREDADIQGDRIIPLATTGATAKAHAVLGGFYQSYLFEEGDCLTQSYDSTAGFSFYGCLRVDPTRVAVNVAVIYDGAYGTTDKDKIINYVGLNNKYPYRHWEGSDWEDSTKVADYLGVESTSQIDKYDLLMYDIRRAKGVPMRFSDMVERMKVDDFVFEWGIKKASGADYNLGEAQSMIGINYNGVYYADLSPFWMELNENTGFSFLSTSYRPGYSASLLPSLNAKNFLQISFVYATMGGNIKSGISQDQMFGTSIELLSKTPVIESYIVSVDTITDNSDATCSTETLEYDAKKIVSANTSAIAECIAIVPNYSPLGYSPERLANLSTVITGETKEEIIDAFMNYFAEAEVLEVVDGSKSLKLGNVLYENVNYGYTVYELIITEADITPTPTVTPIPDEGITTKPFSGDYDEVLQDYELNRVEPSVFKLIDKKVKINRNLWTIDSSYYSTVSCYLCSFDGYTYNTKDYDIVVYDKSSGMTVSKDNALSGTKLLLYNTSNGAFATRNALVNGKTFDTEGSPEYVVDYAFNIVRSISGDKRTVSTISRQVLNESFGKQVLGLDYDNVPKSKEIASGYRNSFATVGVISDTLKFDAIYRITGNKNRIEVEGATHYCSYWDDEWECRFSNTEYYHQLETIPNALAAFNVNGSSYSTVSEDVNVGVHKYSTKVMKIGQNDRDTGITSLRKAPSTGTDRKIFVPAYSVAAIQNHDMILNFYPEVKMMAHEYSGDTISGMDDVNEVEVLTMGEEQRKVQSSSLYIYSIRSAEGSTSDITGVSYSDAALTGDMVFEGDKMIVPGGTDFSVVAQPNFTAYLSGYSLDVINKSVDADGLRISDEKTIPYSDIIADSSDIYSKWGNSCTEKLFKEYKKWVAKMADVRNYQADLKMTISGNGYSTKEYEAFNVSIGYITGGLSSEEEVFPLEIKNGVLLKSTESYKALIKSIASDYACDYDKAVEVFEASGLYTAILDAIESSIADENKSQAGPDELGSSAHWYDEQVKTFVVRRYESTPLHFHDIVSSDKLDYGAVANPKKQATAKFFLTLYFQDEIEPLLGYTIYEPTNAAKKESAVETGNVIINQLYIDGADFLIKNAVTSDF